MALKKHFTQLSRSTKRFIWFALIFCALGMSFVGYKRLVKEQSLFEIGKNLYQQNSCGTCHGEASMLPMRRSAIKSVPNLFMQWNETADLNKTIHYGSYDEDFETAHTENADRLKMPPYVLYLNENEIEALLLYIQANQLLNDPQIKKTQAIKIAINAGCFGCHGALGQGGAVNPLSVKNAIPGWYGDDFDALTDKGEAKYIQQWIEQGHSSAITDKPFGLGYLAKWFLSRQAIKMPRYQQRLNQNEIQLLIEFVSSIRKMGPLNLNSLQAFKNKLDALPEEVKALEDDRDKPVDESSFEDELLDLN